MRIRLRVATLGSVLVLGSIWPGASLAQQEESYDYFRFDLR